MDMTTLLNSETSFVYHKSFGFSQDCVFPFLQQLGIKLIDALLSLNWRNRSAQSLIVFLKN